MAYDKVVDSAALDADLKTVADAIRGIDSKTGSLAFPAGFASLANTVKTNVAAALSAIAEKGVTVGSDANSDDLATLIAAIEAGGGSGGATVHGYFVPAEANIVITNAYSEEPWLMGFCEYGVDMLDSTHTTTRNIAWIGVKNAAYGAGGRGLRLYATANSNSLSNLVNSNGAMFMGVYPPDLGSSTAGIACGSKTLEFRGLIPGRTYLYVAVSAGGN